MAPPQLSRTEVADAENIVEPYAVKGDRLGMSLNEFKATQQKRWVISGSERHSVWGWRPQGGKRIVILADVDQHAGQQTGFLECYFEFRLDDCRGKETPTFAGVGPEGVSYKFFDGKLRRVDIQIERGDFETVSQALAAKYGQPETNRRPVRQTWSNGVSTIILELTRGLSERTGHESLLSFVHDQLEEVALNRKAGANADDL